MAHDRWIGDLRYFTLLPATETEMVRSPILLLMLVTAQTALGLEPECNLLIEASEARIARSAWHSSATIDAFKSEVIKVDGKFYMNAMGEWMLAPMNLDDVERKTTASIRSGEIRVSACAQAGRETIDGVATVVFVYTVEVPGSGIPASQTRMNIGVDDRLPYRLSSTAGEVRQETTYRYTGVTAPM